MKKFIAVLLVLAVLAGAAYYVVNFVINKPNMSDLDALKEKLEKADYMVSYTENGESGDGIIEYFMATNEESEDALVIMVFDDKEYAKLYYRELKIRLDYTMKSLELQIDQYEYMLEKDEDLSESEIERYEKYIEDAEEDLEHYKDIILVRQGDTIWYGTKDAIKASRG